MSTFLQAALGLASRGFHVFPLKPRDKWPIVAGGYKAATRDADYIRLWWTKTPDANVGIACERSQLCVMDADHGLNSLEDFIAWRDRNGIPETYTVRSGSRVEFRVQMYFKGPIPGSKFALDGVTGDIKSIGGLVAAPPSIHPDSGEAYEVLIDAPIVPTPELVKRLQKAPEAKQDLGGIDTESRNSEMCQFIGKIRKQIASLGEPECLAICLARNDRYSKGPMDADEVEEVVRKQYRLYDVRPDPVATVGSSQQQERGAPEPVITDWRQRYHTFEEMENVPDPVFIIDGVLQQGGITAIAAPVGQRKTIIAANMVHAALTGEPLFDFFEVKNRPTRALYLCPEMDLGSFAKRIRNLGLMPYVGKTLFCRTMNSEGRLALKDLTNEELDGALLVVDTAARFAEGDENSAEDMKVFAEDCFRIVKAGAAAVIVLFHSPKGTADASELTLENAMRGSGDLGAFVACCWATRLQNPDEPWKSESYLKNVKQRMFESAPFVVKADELGRLHMVDKPGPQVVLNTKAPGIKADKDGKEAAALQIIKDHIDESITELLARLQAAGIDRKRSWIGNKRTELRGGGVKSTAPPLSRQRIPVASVAI